MLNQNQLSAWLTLLYARVSAKKLTRALKKLHSIELLLSSTKLVLLSFGFTDNQITKIKQPNQKQIQKDCAWLKAAKQCRVITLLDSAYPRLLLEIADPPILLFVKGQFDLLNQPQLAMVGSRRASTQGKAIAFDFAKTLALSGLIINSGMALGIDAASHRGALVTGSTVAVLGTGLAVTYPKQHQVLSQQIEAKGVLVSEFPPFTSPKPIYFPMRNRIISGLSLGVLVVEATKRSGSLITARLALEQGRDVFAIPGSIYNSMAKGCHELIRSGAKIVETIQEVIEDLPLSDTDACYKKLKNINDFSQKTRQTVAHNLDKPHQSLLDCMDDSPMTVDELVDLSGLASNYIGAMLLSLEMLGVVERIPGGYRRIDGQKSGVRIKSC